ncbi:unnamed protein product [Cuscuta europaea]|uniref:Uncharacterized protein n=1 Tax=Cuscuta europaea TaxID=41803 RepID=A0A9P0YQX5_CUSEU|nr:unnamed protein product [Cuscuta europaea]
MYEYIFRNSHKDVERHIKLLPQNLRPDVTVGIHPYTLPATRRPNSYLFNLTLCRENRRIAKMLTTSVAMAKYKASVAMAKYIFSHVKYKRLKHCKALLLFQVFILGN